MNSECTYLQGMWCGWFHNKERTMFEDRSSDMASFVSSFVGALKVRGVSK